MDEAVSLQDLRQAFCDVLSNEAAIELVQAHVESGLPYDARLWAVASDLGWTALPVAPAYGGLGLGLDALGVLYRELGYVLAPIPLAPTFMAAEIVTRAGSQQQQQRWLSHIATGALRTSLSSSFTSSTINGRHEGDLLILNGEALCFEGAAADLFFVLVNIGGARRYVIVDASDAKANLTASPTIDQTRSFACLTMHDVCISIDRLLTEGDPHALLNELALHGALAIAADSVGGAAAILQRTIEHLKVREQFGRPIGSFQALKHRVADHKAALVGAEMLLEEVIASLAQGESVLTDALAAKALASTVYAAVSRDCIQLHGGMGYTWEYPAHFYVKRALLNSQLFGSTADTLDQLTARLAS